MFEEHVSARIFPNMVKEMKLKSIVVQYVYSKKIDCKGDIR
jgi:hypothetical protein